MPFMNRIILLFCLVSWTLGQALGQVSSQGHKANTGIADKINNLGIESSEEDSIQVKYFTLSNIHKREAVIDGSFTDFEKYASVRQFRSGSLTLGNLGSSQVPIIYKPRVSIYKDAGFHQYDNYKLQLNKFRYLSLIHI